MDSISVFAKHARENCCKVMRTLFTTYAHFLYIIIIMKNMLMGRERCMVSSRESN